MHGDMNKMDMIPLDKMYEILDDLNWMGVRAVTYSGGGEPLMHPNINEILARTAERYIQLSAITNGHYLKDKTAELLYNSAWVRISIDYCDEEGFVESRRIKGKNLNIVLDNIRGFAKNKRDSCDLEVNFIITKENHLKIVTAAKLLQDLGVENIRFSPMWIEDFYEYHEPIRDTIFGLLDEAKQLATNRFEILSSYEQVIKVPGRDIHYRPYTKCYVMQFNPVIGADLNVYACHNQAYSNDSIICSIKDQRFREAWFSPYAQEFHNTFECQKVCTGQCAADEKNIFIHELMNCRGDNFV
jgi:MoaA/NifB/PqqE/SkfB family radical SAM enzyme